MEKEIQISDKNLLTILTQEQLTEIASNFSKGDFKQIINSTLQDSVIRQFSDDIYSQQILISILVYGFLKEKKHFIAKNLITSFPFDHKKAIFPYLFLKAKVLISNDSTSLGIAIYSELARRYDKDNDNDEEITKLEAQSQFYFFGNFFNFLFEITNKKSKHIKATIDLTCILFHLRFMNDPYKILSALYQKYPTDIRVEFEYAKQSILIGNMIEYYRVIHIMNVNQSDIREKNPQLNEAYNLNIAYLDMLKSLSVNKYKEAKTKLEEILLSDPINIILINNIGVMDFHEWQISESIVNFKKVEALCPYNDIVKNNNEILSNYKKVDTLSSFSSETLKNNNDIQFQSTK